jgi:hypothetical protein
MSLACRIVFDVYEEIVDWTCEESPFVPKVFNIFSLEEGPFELVGLLFLFVGFLLCHNLLIESFLFKIILCRE